MRDAITSATTALTNANDGICLTSIAHPVRPTPLKLSELIAQLGQIYLHAGDVGVRMSRTGHAAYVATLWVDTNGEVVLG